MSVQIDGVLLDPYGQIASFAEVRFVTLQGAGEVMTTAPATYKTSADGAYSINVQFGVFGVYVRYNMSNGDYTLIKKVIVNSNTQATTLGELLLNNEPLTPPEIAYVEQLVAEAEGYRDEAEQFANNAEQSALDSANSAASSEQSAQEAADSVALLAPVILGDGIWGTDKTYTAYNQYLIYDGQYYSPLPATSLPYAVTTTVPDLALVYPINLNSLQALSGLNDPSGLDYNFSRSFKTVSDLKAGISAGGTAINMSDIVGSKVNWRGYYEESDGGSNWGIVKAGAHIEDGGSVFSIDTNTYVEANLKGKRVSVTKFGAIADGNTDRYSNIASAISHSKNIYIPKSTDNYICDDTLILENGHNIYSDGAVLKHSSVIAKPIIRVFQKSGWQISGDLVLLGGGTASATDNGEVGLQVEDCVRYKVSGVRADTIQGKGVWLTGTKLTNSYYGDRGQFTDNCANDCAIGLQVDIGGSEYNTFTNFNSNGNGTGVIVAGGNNAFIGGKITSNQDGVKLVGGQNQAHGTFSGVDINHNTRYNVWAEDVLLGETFADCHFYGEPPIGGGKIILINCQGIQFDGGILACQVVSYENTGLTEYNYFKNMVTDNGYSISFTDDLGGKPRNCIVRGLTGSDTFDSVDGVNINDTSDCSLFLRRATGDTVAITSGLLTKILLKELDSDSDKRDAYDAVTGVFTVPANMGGRYRLVCDIHLAGTTVTAGRVSAFWQVNTTYQSSMLPSSFYAGTGKDQYTINQTTDIYLNDGDTLDLSVFMEGTGLVFNDEGSFLTIERLS